MPDFYALTSPKLYGVIHRVLHDEKESAHVLSDTYKHIWALRYDTTLKPTMNTLILLAQRFALDRKLTGDKIMRKNEPSSQTLKNLPQISDSELDLLSRIFADSQNDQDKLCYDSLTKDAVYARLGALISNESQS